jgi:hypothetical protein
LIDISWTLSNIIDGFNTGIRAISDFIMFWKFIQVFRYFLKIRNERSLKLAIEVTAFSKFIIGWTIFLFLLCVYQTFTFILTFALRAQYEDFFQLDVWRYYVSFLFFIVFPFRDLFIFSSFAYLYYY